MTTAQTPISHTPATNIITLESGKDGKITHINLYPSRAHITRLFKFRLNVGQNQIVISGLPYVLDDNFVRVESDGTEIVQDVTISQSDKPSVLNSSEFEALTDEKERKTIAIKRKEKTVDALLSSLSSVSVDTATPVNIRHMIQNIDEVADEFDEDLIKLKRELRNLKEDMAHRQPKVSYTKKVTIIVFGESEEEIEFSLHYAVTQAGWTPVYDLRVNTESDSKDNNIQLLYKASITQTTGEDWRDVRLTLETSVPQVNAKLPALTPWKLAFATPSVVFETNTMEELNTLTRAPRSARQIKSVQRPPVANVNFDMENPNATATFELTELKTIYGNGAVHKVALVEIDLVGEIKWVSIPTLKDVRMYRTASILNDSEYPLLKGSSNVYVNGSFTTRSEIPYVSIQERFTCALGVDPTIRVIYHPREKKRSQSGFYTKSNNHVFEQRISVINTKSCDVENVKVIDHIPISEESKISVKLLSPALPVSEPGSEKGPVDMSQIVQVSKGVCAQWEKGDGTGDDVDNLGADGKISWNCSIPAQGKVNLVLSWEVSAPADKAVSGL